MRLVWAVCVLAGLLAAYLVFMHGAGPSQPQAAEQVNKLVSTGYFEGVVRQGSHMLAKATPALMNLTPEERDRSLELVCEAYLPDGNPDRVVWVQVAGYKAGRYECGSGFDPATLPTP